MNWKYYFLALLSFSTFAQQPFQIINRQGTDANTNALLDELELQINRDLPNVNGDRYAKGTANSTNQSMKGIGSDYANDIDLFLVSASLGVAVDSSETSDPDDFDASTLNGLGINQTFTVGANLGSFVKKKIGFIDPQKVDIFLNYASTSRDSSGIDSYDVKNTNFGVHVRYHLLEGQSLYSRYLLKWSGLYLTSGFQTSSSKMKISRRFNESNSQLGANANFAGVSSIQGDTSIVSIPIEISTSVRAFYVLSLYGGLGIDISSGSTDINANIDGDITLSGTASGTADGVLNLGGRGNVDVFSARAFLGLQVNLPVLKFFVQASKQLGSDITAGSAGIKLTW